MVSSPFVKYLIFFTLILLNETYAKVVFPFSWGKKRWHNLKLNFKEKSAKKY